MIAELGQFALIFALATAGVQAWAGLWPVGADAARGEARIRLTERATYAQAGLVAIAFAALMIAHATDDFSVVNVIANSHSAKPFVYKLSGVWGNHEGSLLLWIFVLAGYSAAVALFAHGPSRLYRARVLGVLGLVATAFGAFIVFSSNPFARQLPPPVDGAGLNPLLQDPGLAIHPPFLYFGYVGFAVAFAFAVAALIEQPDDRDWAGWARPWALTAWTMMTIGLVLGSWWAYAELGWGGFWGWDAVENAALMPWLAGAVLLHSLRAVATTGSFRSWAYLVAILTFSLSLVGTFLVRSGLITSVHAFAVDPARGVYLLLIIAAAVGGSLTLYALRAPKTPALEFEPVSRETAILVNNLLFMTILGTVIIGTFYPVINELITGKQGAKVQNPYFNTVVTPFALALMFAAAVGVFLPWRRGDLTVALRPLIGPAIIAGVVFISLFAFYAPREVIPFLALALGAWMASAAIANMVVRVDPQREGRRGRLAAIPLNVWGMNLAHLGAAVFLIGAAGTGALRTERIEYMTPGSVMTLGPREITMIDVANAPGPNYAAERAVFEVTRNGGAPRTISAERRFYPVRRLETAEAGIGGSFGGDVYITVGARIDENGWPVTVSWFPLARWLWWGAALTVLGGFCAILGHARAARRIRGEAEESVGQAAPDAAPAPAE